MSAYDPACSRCRSTVYETSEIVLKPTNKTSHRIAAVLEASPNRASAPHPAAIQPTTVNRTPATAATDNAVAGTAARSSSLSVGADEKRMIPSGNPTPASRIENIMTALSPPR